MSTASSAISPSKGPLIITVLVTALLILHQDNWFWTDGTLVFGFIPIALFWHACISVAAACTWFLATRIAWPLDDSEAVIAAPASNHDSETSGKGEASE